MTEVRAVITYAQYVLYHQWMIFGRPPKNEPTEGGKPGRLGETKNTIIAKD